MSNVKCPQCSLTNWATAITCKRCGNLLQSAEKALAAEQQGQITRENDIHQTAQPSRSYPSTAWTPPVQQQNYQEQNQEYQYREKTGYQTYDQQSEFNLNQPVDLKTGMAVTSMILGIVGFMGSIFLVGVLIAPIALILGIVSLVKANKHPHLYGGKGFAIAGIATSSLVVLFMPVVAAIAVPNLLAARRSANEAQAIATLKNISGAEKTYMAASSGKCGDIPTLIATRMLDVSLATSEKSGYRFIVINLPAGGCEIHATPLTLSHGTRSFFYSTEENIMRGGPKKGAPADKNDFPIKAGG